MKKELIVHFTFLLAFFFVISFYKSYPLKSLPGGWFSLGYWQFWAGGLLGSLLVYTDHFFIAYLMKPQEASSIKAAQLVNDRKIAKATGYLVESHTGKENLIFHNARFQSAFLLFVIFVLTSTGSLVGRGIVLAFALHLTVDMIRENVERKDMAMWFKDFPVQLDARQQKWYMAIHTALLSFMGLFV